MGNPNFERNVNVNTAYYLHWRGEDSAAMPFVRRWIELDEHHFRQGGYCPDGAVMLARIHWARGDEGEARAVIASIERHQADARVTGKTELLLLPNDEMLFEMTGLLVRDAPAAAWEAFVPRARAVAQGQEVIEVLECAGLAALRREDFANARRWWREALDTAAHLPTVMAGRIATRLAELETRVPIE